MTATIYDHRYIIRCPTCGSLEEVVVQHDSKLCTGDSVIGRCCARQEHEVERSTRDRGLHVVPVFQKLWSGIVTVCALFVEKVGRPMNFLALLVLQEINNKVANICTHARQVLTKGHRSLLVDLFTTNQPTWIASWVARH